VSNPWDQPKQTASSGLWLLFAVIAAFGLMHHLDRFEQSTPDDDKREQVEPKPDIGKIEKGSFVIVVEETASRKNFPFLATIQSDRDYWDGLKASGINWGFYDQDSPAVASYESDIKAAGLPALLVITPKGKVRLAKSCPPTTDAIQDALKGIK